nr:MAG TPA: hypothetical protein [Caudoviricetes sp.]
MSRKTEPSSSSLDIPISPMEKLQLHTFLRSVL